MRALIAGNWKMNMLRRDGLALVADIGESLARQGRPAAELLVCPPFTLLGVLAGTVAAHGLALGGQDCHAKASGAHTGDVAAPMLADLGASYVILGHSERRADHGEGDDLVRAKAVAAAAAGLTPIVCVGETLAEREAGRAVAVVEGQLAGSLPGGAGPLVVAYEPVWAIGTGRTPTLEDIAAMHAAIRARVGQGVRILYGGSVKPENAAEILALAEVNGALVGGASLKADSFLAIARAAG
ncbi:MAG: triose-phosphate isomerase [Thalassobaculales bacterium]